jgi:hypothetical protein
MRNQAVTKRKHTKAAPEYRGDAYIFGEKFEVGYTLRMNTGSWSGYPTPSVTITWVADGEEISNKPYYRIAEGVKEVYVKMLGTNSEGIGEGKTPVILVV